MTVIERLPYINARLRARKSWMIGADTLRELVRSAGVDELAKRLEGTRYSKHLDLSRSLFPKVEDAAEDAVNKALSHDLNKVKSFMEADSTPLEWLFSRWDMENLKTVFRGLYGKAPPSRMVTACILAGYVEQPIWRELANARGVKEGVELAASMRLAPQSVLSEGFSAYKTTGKVRSLESSLERWFYAAARSSQGSYKGSKRHWRKVAGILEEEIDLENLERVVEAAFRHGAPSLMEGGTIPWEMLIGKMGDSQAPLEVLATEIEHHPLAGLSTNLALELTAGSEGPAMGLIERARWKSRCGHLSSDPLGLTLCVGYIWSRVAEALDLRRIIWGLHFGFDREQLALRLLSV